MNRAGKIILYMSMVVLSCSCQLRRHGQDLDLCVIEYEKLQDKDIDTSLLKPSLLVLKKGLKGMNLSQIDKIVIDRDSYYVLDARKKRIVKFDAEGYPLKKIGQRGRASTEYLQISDFTVNQRGEIVISDGTQDRFVIYNTEGEYLSSCVMKKQYGKIIALPEEKYLTSIQPWDRSRGKGAMVALCDDSFNRLSSVGHYNEVDSNFTITYVGFNYFNGNICFAYPMDDRLFCFNQAGVPQNCFLVDFGRRAVPPKMKGQVEWNMPKVMECSFLTGAICVDSSNLVLSSIQNGKGVDEWVSLEAKTKMRLPGTDTGVRLLGSSGRTIFMTVEDAGSLQGMEKYLPVMNGVEDGDWIILCLTVE